MAALLNEASMLVCKTEVLDSGQPTNEPHVDLYVHKNVSSIGLIVSEILSRQPDQLIVHSKGAPDRLSYQIIHLDSCKLSGNYPVFTDSRITLMRIPS